VARRKSPTLTEAELRLMDVVWDKGAATAGDVLEALPGRPSTAYSTVVTTLRILEEKGYLRHTKEGRAFVYHPVVGRSEASRSAVRHLLRRFFNDSPELLVLNVLKHEHIDGPELKRLRKLIEESEASES
jgi:BlaI family transcriptional regulator, penicillinase repressor